jgi:hypothetical protein
MKKILLLSWAVFAVLLSFLFHHEVVQFTNQFSIALKGDIPQMQPRKGWLSSSGSSTPQPNSGLKNGFLQKKYEKYSYVQPEIRLANTSYDECGSPPHYDQYFKQSLQVRSKNNEDHDLFNKVFKDSAELLDSFGSTYVEIGAFDGIRESNSRFFDVCLGWDGLLIEPNPSIYPRLIVNRKNSHRMNFAPSCSIEEEALNKTVLFHPYPFTNAGMKGANNAYEGKHEVPVPCGSLTPVLQDIFHGKVAFFSLDVEGSEPFILEHIDFSKVRFGVIIVENSNNLCGAVCESRDQVRDLMKKAGYLLYDSIITKSDLFIHSETNLHLQF